MKKTLKEIMALDAMLDTLVFGRPLGLFGENIVPKEEMSMDNALAIVRKAFGTDKLSDLESKPKVIGKEYLIPSNAYAYDKTHKCNVNGVKGVTMEIVSEPYCITDHNIRIPLIDVKSHNTDIVYGVLFEESGIK